MIIPCTDDELPAAFNWSDTFAFPSYPYQIRPLQCSCFHSSSYGSHFFQPSSFLLRWSLPLPSHQLTFHLSSIWALCRLILGDDLWTTKTSLCLTPTDGNPSPRQFTFEMCPLINSRSSVGLQSWCHLCCAIRCQSPCSLGCFST